MVSLVIDSGKVNVFEERLLYSPDNFVADIGGYLGLLLGQSLLTMFDMVVKLARKWI